MFALHRLCRVKLDDLDHVDQLVELLGDLLEGLVFDIHHNRDPGQALDLAMADGEAFNVEAAAGEQAGDASQQAGFVLDEEAQNVSAHGYSSSQVGACSLAYCT